MKRKKGDQEKGRNRLRLKGKQKERGMEIGTGEYRWRRG